MHASTGRRRCQAEVCRCGKWVDEEVESIWCRERREGGRRESCREGRRARGRSCDARHPYTYSYGWLKPSASSPCQSTFLLTSAKHDITRMYTGVLLGAREKTVHGVLQAWTACPSKHSRRILTEVWFGERTCPVRWSFRKHGSTALSERAKVVPSVEAIIDDR